MNNQEYFDRLAMVEAPNPKNDEPVNSVTTFNATLWYKSKKPLYTGFYAN